MRGTRTRCAAFAVCGSFCTLDAALDAARALRGQGWELLPVMSFAAGQDTRFGRGMGWRQQLEGLTGHPVLDTLQAVEPLGPRRLADALVIAPCTGATLARLAEGLSDTPVTLAIISCLTGRMTRTRSPRASRRGSSCCPRPSRRRWKDGSCSRYCSVHVDEKAFQPGKSVVY